MIWNDSFFCRVYDGDNATLFVHSLGPEIYSRIQWTSFFHSRILWQQPLTYSTHINYALWASPVSTTERRKKMFVIFYIMGPGAWRLKGDDDKKTSGYCYATFMYPAWIVMQIVSPTKKRIVENESQQKKRRCKKGRGNLWLLRVVIIC